MYFIQQITQELIRALRLPVSQTKLYLKLGYKYNIISRWETGERKITWSEFQNLCKCLNININKSLQLLFKNQDFSNSDVFKLLVADKNWKDVIKLLNISKSKFYRIINLEEEAHLTQIFELINFHGDLVRFIQSLVTEGSLIPTLEKEINRSKKAKIIFNNFPLASPILLLFKTQAYKTSNQDNIYFIKEKYKISEKLVNNILDQLLDCDLVKLENEKFHPTSEYLNLGWTNKEDLTLLNDIEKFWIEQAQKSFEPNSMLNRETIGFQIFNGNKKVKNEIKEAINQFYYNVHRLLEDNKDEPKDTQFLLNYQILTFKD